jgi:hypothetical protein
VQSPFIIKTIGYFISMISVVLLAALSWPEALENSKLMFCLIGGVITSIAGMLCRWLSYSIEKKHQEK